jgi:Tfp pilus assembly protein PilX
MTKRVRITYNEQGQILAIVLIVLAVVLFTVLSVIGGAQVYSQNAQHAADVERATALAEAGVDKALTSLNSTGGSYSGEAETTLGNGSYSVTITSIGVGSKLIQSSGYIPNKENAKVKRTVKVKSTIGTGVAFVYGLQVGEGGLELGNSNIVEGSVYSNGNIVAGNGNQVNGDILVAGGPSPTADQQTDCSDSNCQDFIFGKSVSGQDRFDVAQSFRPTTDGILNKVSVKIKKVGNPSDATVRIMQNEDGEPDKNEVLSQGTLYSSLVTDDYGWIDITFNSSPVIDANQTYWLMIDTDLDNNNYWIWQADLAQSYTGGLPAWSPNWSTGNPIWNLTNPAVDLSFKSFLGGAPTSVRAGNNKMTVSGAVRANTIENLIIGQDAYYQTIISSTVGGTSHPGSADPAPKVFPISDANVTNWKQSAEASGEIEGITGCVSNIDSKKIVGDVSFGSGCRVTLKSPIWITGNLTLNSNNILTLDSSYGGSSGVIIVDGKVTLNSNNHLNGTDTDSSLLMVLSTFDSRTNGESAVVVNSNGNTGVYYAGTGTIEPGTGNSFKELTAWKIKVINNSIIDYETGLSSTMFTSGPSGAYSLVKGTYQVK